MFTGILCVPFAVSISGFFCGITSPGVRVTPYPLPKSRDISSFTHFLH